MLEKLTAYKTFGSSAHLAEIARAIVSSPCTVADLFVIADSNGAVEIPRIKAAVALLKELDLCMVEGDKIAGSTHLASMVNDLQPSGVAIGLTLFHRMINEGLIPIERIRYDLDAKCGYLRQRDIPIRYSQMRNYLIDSGILIVNEGKMLFSQSGLSILQKKTATLEGGMTPEELLTKLERNREAGAEAEAFVMDFERGRLGEPLAEALQQVSLISVSAGYDIASFETDESTRYDRFIEVKAVGSNGFYLSTNELQAAKKFGKQYYLYLVDMRKKGHDGYKPEIIQNPSVIFAESGDWRIIPESYHITRIS